MKNLISTENKKIVNDILTIVFAMLAVYFVLWAFTGNWVLNSNVYNSYSLQARRWLDGFLDLGQNYEHLELAIFEGKFFVSFPPFPSVVLLPFVLIFGTATPDHLITCVCGIIGAIYIYKIARHFEITSPLSIMLALLATVASNFLFVGANGGVWFIAQTMSFTFTTISLYFAINDNKNNGWLSLLFWAFAVGCRPMQIIYIPVLLYFLYFKAKGNIIKRLWWALPTLAVAIFYMWLNYSRFGSIIEFGHNYLPEFIESPEGQFSVSYILPNLQNMFKIPQLESFASGNFGKVAFPTFNGFAFYLVSPVFLLYFICFVKRIFNFKNIENKFLFFATPVLIAIHILLLCAHKTLGGWQFGNRYTIDFIPISMLGLCALFPKTKGLEKTSIAFLFFGMALNLVGSIAVYNFWI